jgi:hypothetical protein
MRSQLRYRGYAADADFVTLLGRHFFGSESNFLCELVMKPLQSQFWSYGLIATIQPLSGSVPDSLELIVTVLHDWIRTIPKSGIVGAPTPKAFGPADAAQIPG